MKIEAMKPIKELVVPAYLDKGGSSSFTYLYCVLHGSVRAKIEISKETIGVVPPEKLLVAIRFRRWWQRLWFRDGWCGGKK